MAQTTSLVFNGGAIPSPSPAPSGNGKAKLLKIGEITVTEQDVQVTKNVICDPDSVTTVAPFMEVLTSARLAELVQANNILVLDDSTMQYLMSDASIAVEEGTSVCTAVNFLGLSKEIRAKVLYPCTRLTDELTLQQVIEVGEPVETDFNHLLVDGEDSVSKYLEDAIVADENGLLRVRVDENEDSTPEHPDKVLVIDDHLLREDIDNNAQRITNLEETIDELDMDSVPHAYLHSTLNKSAGDSSTTRTTVDIFAYNETPEGDCFEFEQTTTIDDTPYGYLWIEPGTYLINGSVTLQWVGSPRGTFVAKVGSVMGENFDFSQEQEILRNHTKIVTIPNRMKLSINITYDAGTPVMGFWIQSLQVVKLAGGMSQTNIMHDDTLVGQGSVADPIRVDEAKVAQSTLAGNLAPAFDPNKPNYSGKDYAYGVGEKVIHNGLLYRFKAPHSGAWNASHVTLADVASLTSQKFLNGGLANTGNVNKVRTVAMPFNFSGRTVCVRISRPVSASGNYYEIYGRVANSYEAIGSDLALSTYSPYQVIQAKKDGEVLTINAPSAKVIAIEIAEYDSSRTPVPLRVFDFEGWTAEVVEVDVDEECDKLPKYWGSIPSGGTLAYLTGAAGGHLKWSYRYGGNNCVVVGTAMATFTNTTNNLYKHIDYIQSPAGYAFPFKMQTDGTRHRIVSTAPSDMEITTVFCGGNWKYNDSWASPPSWNGSNVSDEGAITNVIPSSSDLSPLSIAPAFDPNKPNYSGKDYAYGVGEKVIHNGLLYRFKAPHSGAWDASHVALIDVVSLTSQKFLNGGLANTGNVNKVRTVAMPFNFSGKNICVRISRPVSAAGNYYEMYGRVSNSYEAIGSDLALSTYSPYQVIAAKKEGEVFTINAPDAKVIAIEIAEYDSSRTPVPLRNFDFEGWTAEVVEVGTSTAAYDITLDYSLINSIARLNVSSNNAKDFCSLIVTDSHNDNDSVRRAIKYANESISISSLIHCGDYAGSYITYGQSATDWGQSVSSSQTKPVYFVMGNHEKGSFANIRTTPTDDTLYNLFVKPIVDKGFLSSGEYETGKCYYYHDFTATKVRLIVLDEFRAPMDYLETYWQAIEYDSSLPNIADNTDYVIGDKVNVSGFAINSFQAVQNVNTGAFNSGKQPCYKCVRGWRYIDQVEASWFLDTLYSVPSDYVVVVAAHFPFSELAIPDKSKKFCQQVNIPDDVTGADWSANYMASDFIADALNAFKNGTTYSATITPKSGSSAAYIDSYTVTKDFSIRGPGELGLIIGGHVHRDVVWKHSTYTYMYQVTPMCSITTSSDNNRYADIRLQNDTSSDSYIDSLTAFAVADDRTALAKLGCKCTTDCKVRDMEIL